MRRNPVTCPTCGRRVPDGAAVCQVCDEPVRPPVFVVPAGRDPSATSRVLALLASVPSGVTVLPSGELALADGVAASVLHDAVHGLVVDEALAFEPRAAALDLVKRLEAATGVGLGHGQDAVVVEAAYGSCTRSPCEVDPKIEAARLAEAWREVGRPKARVGRPPGLLYVAYGLGVDSTAILVGLAQLVRAGRPEFRPDYVVFADTGVEREASYDYLDVVNPWLARQGFPQVTIVGWATEFTAGGYGSARTLEQQVILNQQMPAICATKNNGSQCSLLWKQDAQQRWLELESGLFHRVPRTIETARGPRRVQSLAVKPGVRIVKAIGFDADETNRQTRGTFRTDDDRKAWEKRGLDYPFDLWFPLQEWGWDRARCVVEIQTEIGVVPPKSSCTFCYPMKPHEIERLTKDELLRSIFIELLAMNGHKAHAYATHRGLGGRLSWKEYALARGLVTQAEVDALLRDVERVIALPHEKGLADMSQHPVIRSLPAFSRVRGARGRGLPMWDRHDRIEGPDATDD